MLWFRSISLFILWVVHVCMHAQPAPNLFIQTLKNHPFFKDNEGDKFSEVFFAQLDSTPEKEAVIQFSHDIGEGYRDYFITILNYNNTTKQANFVYGMNTHLEFVNSGAVWIQDVDGNQKDEIIVIGDTEGITPRNIFIYQWSKDTLLDMMWGVDPGVEYALTDLNNDKKYELIALSQESDTKHIHFSILELNEGTFKPSLILPQHYLKTFEYIIQNHLHHTTPNFLELITLSLKQKKITPTASDSLHSHLVQIYQESTNPEIKIACLRAMEWETNTYALPFLSHLIKDNTHNIRTEALKVFQTVAKHNYDSLLIIQVKKEFDPKNYNADVDFACQMGAYLQDTFSLRFIHKQLLNDSLPLQKRRVLLLAITKHLYSYFDSTLLRLSLHHPDKAVQRLAGTNLLKPDKVPKNIRILDVVPLLQHPDADIRAAIQGGIGYFKNIAVVPYLIESLDKERLAWNIRQTLFSLYQLKYYQIYEKYIDLLKKQPNPDIRRQIHALISIHPNPEVVKWGLQEIAHAEELTLYDSLLVKQKISGADEYLLKYANDTTDSGLRRTAIQRLKYYPTDAVKNFAKENYTKDTVFVVKKAFLEMFALWRDTTIVPVLLKWFRKERKIRSEIATALATLNTYAAKQALFDSLSAEDNTYIFNALSLIKNDVLVQDRVFQYLQQTVYNIQQDSTGFKALKLETNVCNALSFLVQRKDDRLENVVQMMLNIPYLQAGTLQALGQGQDKKYLPVIQKYVNHHKRVVRIAALEAIESLQ
ncbi:MAG: HEAT repeat domain-containing protein [Bacteroidia bacterium]|nr:HEAT repeat domain-containing protein [Bacteroidia bacterium]MDW8345374.1 HEAT repeat domain-containing protein [Bacteroidia bacterium]